MTVKKVTIREWLYTQHMPPDVREDVEKLFALGGKWRSEASGSNPDPEAFADELEGILGQ